MSHLSKPYENQNNGTVVQHFRNRYLKISFQGSSLLDIISHASYIYLVLLDPYELFWLVFEDLANVK